MNNKSISFETIVNIRSMIGDMQSLTSTALIFYANFLSHNIIPRKHYTRYENINHKAKQTSDEHSARALFCSTWIIERFYTADELIDPYWGIIEFKWWRSLSWHLHAWYIKQINFKCGDGSSSTLAGVLKSGISTKNTETFISTSVRAFSVSFSEASLFTTSKCSCDALIAPCAAPSRTYKYFWNEIYYVAD